MEPIKEEDGSCSKSLPEETGDGERNVNEKNPPPPEKAGMPQTETYDGKPGGKDCEQPDGTPADKGSKPHKPPFNPAKYQPSRQNNQKEQKFDYRSRRGCH